MRATALLSPVAALTAALLLTSCGDGDGDSGGEGTPKKTAAGACAFGDLEMKVGPANAAPAPGDSGNVPVTLTNKGAKCTLEGLPSVTLTADGTSAGVAPDPAATGEKRTLAEGGSMTVIITYVRGEEGGGLAPKSAEFGLPGADATQDFPWSYGVVALKDGKPDATVSGFQQGD
ncbi:DUF4232 domain-containing protein [Streptomyces sp. G1]|uniref:DUF4232 domain-containing protein n=1 Tax=Streptomyces sp. G1 TaxID=361572 RepID=UPI00202F7851|nr:DUF4232 domain-containing protein [Streptomyces sp. G1]MCM1974382.1 DUF4232 domain-containing protein [Streptomyces sp. G1]